MSKATRRFIVNKVLEMLITLVVVTLISFLLVRLSPIDPAEAYARRSFAAFSFTDEQMEALREDMGLNDPLPVQYVTWVRDALHLDFGKSFVSGQPVFEKVTTAIGITVTIVLISAVIQAVFILLFGCLCYLTRKRMIGHALIFLCIAGVSIPSFFFASTYLDIFAVKLGLTSVAGNTGLMRYLPAAVCIGIGCIALFSPMLANNIQKEMEQDSAFYARCRGLSEGKILLRYALPNAVVTLLPSFCQMLGLCMAGSAIVERVFSLPGLACGASKMRIMLVHILPNIIRDVVQFICLSCAEMIIAISGFSFIGLSLGDDVIDWGVMLSDARALAGTHLQLLFYPIFFIFKPNAMYRPVIYRSVKPMHRNVVYPTVPHDLTQNSEAGRALLRTEHHGRKSERICGTADFSLANAPGSPIRKPITRKMEVKS